MANETVVTSKRWTLDWRDLGKGLIMAVGAPVIEALLEVLNTGDYHFNWLKIGGIGLAAGLTYLLKNFFTPAEVKRPVQ